MKKVVVGCLLVISLGANVFLGWKVFSQDRVTQNQAVEYASTVQCIDQANAMIHQASVSKGAQETSLLFQAYNYLFQAQVFFKDYEQTFLDNGIQANDLEPLLVDETSDLRLDFGNQIMGKAVDQTRLQNVEKNLAYLSTTLPHSYTGPTQEIKDAFAKLQQQ